MKQHRSNKEIDKIDKKLGNRNENFRKNVWVRKCILTRAAAENRTLVEAGRVKRFLEYHDKNKEPP